MCFFAGGIKYAEQGFGVSECRSRFVSHFSVQDAVFSVSVQDAVFFSILVQDAVFFRFRAGRSLCHFRAGRRLFPLFVQSAVGCHFRARGGELSPFPSALPYICTCTRLGISLSWLVASREALRA